MRIETAIKKMTSLPDSWVRVELVLKIRNGLELSIAVHNGKRGPKVDAWRIECLGTREFTIDDLDGGGVGLYPSTHPAARQYVAPTATLRWRTDLDAFTILGALSHAHWIETADWIPLDRYLDTRDILANRGICRGPDFLLRAYVNALSKLKAAPGLTVRKNRKSKIIHPKVLHFGSCYVVAATFAAERC